MRAPLQEAPAGRLESNDSAAAKGPPHSLARISTGEGNGKRGRKHPPAGPRDHLVSRDTRGAKKPRGAPGGGSHKDAHGARPNVERVRDDNSGAKGKQQNGQDLRRPWFERRAGTLAPNGNPQCWIAPGESEADPHRVAQRFKQVEYGKNSTGYKEYLRQVPKCAPATHGSPAHSHTSMSKYQVAQDFS